MQRDTLSSSDEDDTQNQVMPNEVKHAPSTPPRRSTFSSLHIEDDTRIYRRFTNLKHLMFSKRHVIYFFLPLSLLLLLVIFFTTDVRNVFSPNFASFSFKLDSLSENMKESELRALYLLRQQQFGLLGMWNYTVGVDSLNNSHSLNSSSVDHLSFKSDSLNSFEDLKSALLKQISLNKEIQQVLLSAHHTGKPSELGFGDGNVSAVGFDYGRCWKKDRDLSQRKTIEWKPKPDKFLFAICLSGQMSNHLICLEKHMFFAAVLNRVLVMPSPKFDYQYHKVLDIDHINKCLGRKVVVTFEEFEEMRKKHVHINKFICYFSLPRPCDVDDDHVKKLKALGISMGNLEAAWVEDISQPKKRTIQDIQSKFSSDEDVIAIGDLFYADAEKEWVMQPGGPLAHKCKTLIEPSRVIMITAQRFIQTFLGKNFIALHFRRHGFLKFCNVKNPSCFYPIPQAADCIARIVERANAPVIYLSTDAAESETGLLQSLVVLNGKPVPLVKRPSRNWAEKWDALLYRNKLEGDSQVEAMLDKTICALSEVFIGASGSTFTEDILRLRKDWGSASMCDEYLCQGELPNFIAENE